MLLYFYHRALATSLVLMSVRCVDCNHDHSADISAAESFTFPRVAPQPAFPRQEAVGESSLVATVLPAPPDVVAMHADQNNLQPVFVRPLNAVGDGDDHGDDDVFSNEVVSRVGGERSEVISSSKRTREEFDTSGGDGGGGGKDFYKKRRRNLHPDELTAPAGELNANSGKGKRVRTSVTKSVKVVVGNVHMARIATTDPKKSAVSNEVDVGGGSKVGGGNNVNIRNFRPTAPKDPSPWESKKTRLDLERERLRKLQKKSQQQLNHRLKVEAPRPVPPTNRWVPIVSTAATTTTTTNPPSPSSRSTFLTAKPPVPTIPLPLSHHLRGEGSSRARSSPPPPHTTTKARSDSAETASLDSLLVADPYKDPATTPNTLEEISTAVSFEPKLIPAVIPTAPPPFRPSQPEQPATRPSPRSLERITKHGEDLAITFLPPLSDALFDFPSEKPIFISQTGPQKRGKIFVNERPVFGKLRRKAVVDDGVHSNKVYSYQEPRYRPPIRDLGRQRLTDGRVPTKDFSEEKQRTTSLPPLPPFTSPGPPYGVSVTPSQFTVVSPPPTSTTFPSSPSSSSASPPTLTPPFDALPDVEISGIDFEEKEAEVAFPREEKTRYYDFAFSNGETGTDRPPDGDFRPVFPSTKTVRAPHIADANIPEIIRHISTYSVDSPAIPTRSGAEEDDEAGVHRQPKRRLGTHHGHFVPLYEVEHSPETVDFGAATGGGGAFGWYSDHPVLTIGW